VKWFLTASRIGLLTNLDDPKAPPQFRELEAAGSALEIKIIAADGNAPEALEHAFQKLESERVDVIIVLQTTMLVSERIKIATLAAAKRLPAIYGYREHVEDGGLISYGVNLHWCYRHAAVFVQKIWKGASPGDLPVEFPTEIELVINLKTAKALGLTVPPGMLVAADEVIE
jgi:putative ABC transport system substrate-binding protein